MLHRQDFSTLQPIKVTLDFRPVVPAATSSIGYDLLITNETRQAATTGTFCSFVFLVKKAFKNTKKLFSQKSTFSPSKFLIFTTLKVS